jgi:hypothetical protein
VHAHVLQSNTLYERRFRRGLGRENKLRSQTCSGLSVENIMRIGKLTCGTVEIIKHARVDQWRDRIGHATETK